MFTFDNEYNRNLSNKYINNLRNKENENQPEIFGGSNMRFIGGGDVYRNNTLQSYYKNVNDDKTYIQPGTVSGYPQFNMIELRELDSKPLIKVSPMQGGKNNINMNMDGGFNFSDIISSLKSVAKPAISSILDIGAPMLGEAVGGPIIGAIGATVARNILKQKTGYGRTKIKKVAGVGVLSKVKTPKTKKISPTIVEPIVEGGKTKRTRKSKSKLEAVIDAVNLEVKPKETKTTKSKTTKNINSSGGLKKRFEIVKQIMKEKNLSLPAASKYVKDNKLY